MYFLFRFENKKFIVVPSNHDDFVGKWLASGAFTFDIVQKKLLLKLERISTENLNASSVVYFASNLHVSIFFIRPFKRGALDERSSPNNHFTRN